MAMSNFQSKIRLRPATAGDIGFMRELYTGTRMAEMTASGLPEPAFKQFLAVQFAAQYQHYTTHYSADDFNIIEADGIPIGRFFVDYRRTEIRVVDITLAPQARGQGLGSYLFQTIFDQARVRKCPVTIHVDRSNRALRWYERMGFTIKANSDPLYLLMEWTPSGESCRSATHS